MKTILYFTLFFFSSFSLLAAESQHNNSEKNPSGNPLINASAISVCSNKDLSANQTGNDTYDSLPAFRISEDGQPLEKSAMQNAADLLRCTDVALEKAKIQIQYDNLLLKPRLGVTAWPPVIAYQDNPNTEAVENLVIFSAYSNYRAFFEKGEIRLFQNNQSFQTQPWAVLPLDDELQVFWQHPGNEHGKFSRPESTTLKYVLRVYDRDGKFDETQAQTIAFRKQINYQTLTENTATKSILKNYGESQLILNNININGGTVTVNGVDIPSPYQVSVMGINIPKDDKGAFVSQQIVPHGFSTVEVALLNEEGNGQLFHRDIHYYDHDWFYVGIADLTIGLRDTNGPWSEVSQDSNYDDDNFIDGRLAFYVKGKTAGDLNITASADTREQPIKDLFTNFTNKDPGMLFRRLDPDLYYPTFGDDSTLEEDAPTQGKFYFKAQKNKNYGLWGNFETKLLDTELARIDRGLYGAVGHYQSQDTTRYGEQKTELDLFAAEPGTLGARESFRGTGGSLYFLKHQNISLGSERIGIEVRDKDTDIVVDRRRLIAGSDYDIDPIQGRVVLNAPLASSSNDGLLVRDDSIAGNSNFLVVSYEYTPGFEDLNDVVVGGRASTWFGDHVQLGVTGNDQEQTGGDQKLKGADLTLRFDPFNYIKLEVAQTEGLASDQLASFDGGFEFTDPQSSVINDEAANAQRIETAFKLGTNNSVTAFHQIREQGFSSTGQFVDTDTEQYGLSLNSRITDTINFSSKLSARQEDIGQEVQTLDAIAAFDLNKQWQLDAGFRFDKQENTNPLIPVAIDQGERTDATLKLGYDNQIDWSTYGFIQSTVDRDDTRDANNRLGTGGLYKVNDHLNVTGEVSEGDTGTGAKVGTEYLVSDRTQLYLAYALENERSGNSNLRGQKGDLTTGFKSRYTDTLSIYGEEHYAYGDQPVGLTHLYGVDFAPTEALSIGISMETGKLTNIDGNEIERLAIGLSLGYSSEQIKYITALEFRNDKSTGNERDTWLLRNELIYKNSDDWRTLAKLNYSKSNSSQGEFFDGDFTEAVWGYAYRPINNDRLNALFKYTYFFNKPAPEQVSTGNVNSEFIQRSHILSTDISYDLSKTWSIGGKYAFRRGELALDRVNPDYFRSDAHLLVLRADLHILKNWDFLVEARTLELPDAGDNRKGFLTGIYRHLGQNMKLGLGYNFTDFSDDLTDLSFDSQGIFINVIGKF